MPIRSREIMIGGAAAIAQVINLLTNPDFEAAGSAVAVRTNRDTNPRNLGTPTSGRAPGRNAYTSGSPTGTYAMSGEIQQLTVTAMAAGVGTERFGITSTQALGSLYPANTPVTVSMDTSVVALPAGVRARVYVDVQDTTNANVTRAHWDAYFDYTTGRISGTMIPNGTADRVLMYVWIENNNAGAAFSGTATVGFTKVMVETNYAAPYLDGGTQPALRTNQTRNPRQVTGGYVGEAGLRYSGQWARSFESGVTPTPTGITTAARALCTASTSGSGFGFDWYGNADSASPGNTGTWLDAPQVTPGQSVSVMAWVRASKAQTGRLGVRFFDHVALTWTTAQLNVTAALTAGAWVLLINTQTVPAGATRMVVQATMSGAGSFIAGDFFDQTGLFIGPTPDYFDGATTKAGFTYAYTGTANNSTSTEVDADLSVSWQGTANNSVSQLTGISIVGPSSVGAIAFIRSTRWKLSGQYSGRMIATSATVSISYANYSLSGVSQGGTFVVTSYQEAPITGSSWAMLGRLYTNPASATYQTSPRPNAAGTFEHRLVFGPNQAGLILAHGGTLGSPDIWYDLALLVADPTYSGPAFTGSTPSKDGVVYRWSAGVDASTSIKETYTISGGLQLNDPQGRWWIARATSPRTPAARRHTAIALPGRDGDYPITREERNSGTYGLVMHIQGSNAAGNYDAAAADRNLSRLLSAMSGEFLMTETLYSADGNPLIRQAYGQILNGVSPTRKPTLKVLEVTMPINLTDGRWMTPAVTQVTPTSLTVGLAPVYFYELPGVDAETDDIIIRISNKNNTGRVSLWGGEANARAGGVFGTRTGIFYAATIPASNYVFIDVKNFVAKQTTSAGDWAMQTGTDVTANLDYPPSGKLELSPSYISTLDTSIYVAFIQAEAAATAAAVTIQVRGTYQ